jgi:hypothetical protein
VRLRRSEYSIVGQRYNSGHCGADGVITSTNRIRHNFVAPVHVRSEMMSSIFRCSESLVHRFFAMSSNDVFSKLSSPLHDLLTGLAQQDQQQLGVSEKDQAEIAGWIEKAAQSDFVKSDAFLVCAYNVIA